MRRIAQAGVLLLVTGCMGVEPDCAAATSCAAGIQVEDRFYYGSADQRIDRSLLGEQIAKIVDNQPCSVCEEPPRPATGEALGGGPIGAKVYTLNGYRASFRVAALDGNRMTIFERPARFGRDMLDLVGKVIGITSREVGAHTSRKRLVISDSGRIASIVRAIEASRFGQPRRGNEQVDVTFQLRDGASISMRLDPKTGALDGRLLIPREVVRALTTR